MTQYQPPLDNVLATVRAFVERLARCLEGETRYDAQVAAYLLAICEREVQLGRSFDADERRRLAGLLGHDGEVDALNAELATGLRSGALDEELTRVTDVLLAIAADRVALVRPDHLDGRHRSPAYSTGPTA